jgi:tetratricopeptide (TPR) repeat protein
MLEGGRSSAAVYCVHVDVNANASFEPGEYILKLDEPREYSKPAPTERELHTIAEGRNRAFTAKHIPTLVRDVAMDGRIAMLYNLAGSGLSSVSTPYSLGTGLLSEQCRVISRELLEDFNFDVVTEAAVTARSTLELLLGYRLDPDAGRPLHDFVHDECGGHSSLLVSGRLLANALWFCNAACIRDDVGRVRFGGLLHGDLHPQNILLARPRPDSLDYYLIDFALSLFGPLGYDHAYLEVALTLHFLDHFGPQRVISLLSALDADPKTPASSQVAPEDFGTLQVCRSIRDEIRSWQSKRLPKSTDSVDAQILLTRVAAGLNWANKPLDAAQRRLALAYACYSATQYLDRFHPSEWHGLELEAAKHLKSGAATAATTAQSNWTALRQAVEGFDRNIGKFVLVAPRPSQGADIPSLGMLPWSAVVDLDPDSDRGGCFDLISPVLAKNRSVQPFGKQRAAVDFKTGTAWLMAAGWNSHDETVSTEQEWRWQYPGQVRSLCEELQSWRPLIPTFVVVFAEGASQERLARVLDEMDSTFREFGRIVVVGPEDVEIHANHQHFRISWAQFAESVQYLYGSSVATDDFGIPGKGGMVSLPIEELRHLEEDLEILHSRITEGPQSSGASDQFWRGNPPTWGDLAGGQAVNRDIQSKLQEAIEVAADINKTQTITIYHSPGAGGTTLALRVAWDNRAILPTAVLRRFSRYTSDRLDSLYHRTEKHILLIADGSVLPEPDREQLFRDLADRHARVIILHVQRTMSRVQHEFALPDPMDEEEAARFASVFVPKAPDYSRQQDLKRIATSNDPKWSVYRLPFFFGLIAFDERYLGVEHYTVECLRDATYRIKKALKFLALVTNYSQAGMDEQCVLGILDLDQQLGGSLTEMFGQGPAHLVVRQDDTLRVIHPTVARQILRNLIGGNDWEAGLKDASIELIQGMRKLLGQDPASTKSYMESLFIRRYELGETDPGQSSTRTFSPLILDIGRNGSPEGEQEVFEALTGAYDRHSHYWHHRARHIIYRLHRDYETALQCAERAIELDPYEMVHYHNKGQVLRYWARDIMDGMLSGGQTPSPLDLLSAVQNKVEAACEAFTVAHTRTPDSRYPHISRMQLVIEVAERLIRSARKQDSPSPAAEITLQDLIRAGGGVAAWLEANVIVAEEDLEAVRHIRADNDANYIERKTESDLSQLYGNFDNMISVWESLLGSAANSALARRNLANAYYGRTNRQWDLMGDVDLQRIQQLMDENLSSDPANGRDIRVWFQTARRLPSFSFNTALDRLSKWIKGHETADGHYYLYILHYLMWRRSRSTIGEELIVNHIKRCKELAMYRRDYCYEWLAVEPAWCPIIDHATLGKMAPPSKGARRTALFKDDHRLDRAGGTTMPGFERQGGNIRLGGRLTAFFVPGEELYAYKDQQREVNFYLGFSYEGLRAWDAQPGPPRGGAPKGAHSPQPKAASGGGADDKHVKSGPGPRAAPEPDFRTLAQKTLFEIVQSAPNGRIRISDLGQLLDRAFPRVREKIPAKAGFGNLTQMVLGNPGLLIDGDFVSLRHK